MVDILQHVSHSGVGSVCHTGQRHRVPLADLDQAWADGHGQWERCEKSLFCLLSSLCKCACTFSLCSRAVRVAQRQQGHLYQLVKQQVSLDQHKLSMLFSSLSFQRAFLVLHHAEHRQQAPWGDGQMPLCHTAWLQHIGSRRRTEGFLNQKEIRQKTQCIM